MESNAFENTIYQAYPKAFYWPFAKGLKYDNIIDGPAISFEASLTWVIVNAYFVFVWQTRF